MKCPALSLGLLQFCLTYHGQRRGTGVDRVLVRGRRADVAPVHVKGVEQGSTAFGRLLRLWVVGGDTWRSAAPMKARVYRVNAGCAVRFCDEHTASMGICDGGAKCRPFSSGLVRRASRLHVLWQSVLVAVDRRRVAVSSSVSLPCAPRKWVRQAFLGNAASWKRSSLDVDHCLTSVSARSFLGVVSVWRPLFVLAQVRRQAWRWRRLVPWAETRCCETEEHFVDVLQLVTCFV